MYGSLNILLPGPPRRPAETAGRRGGRRVPGPKDPIYPSRACPGADGDSISKIQTRSVDTVECARRKILCFKFKKPFKF